MDLPRRIVDGGAGEWERQVLRSGELDMPSENFRRQIGRKLGVVVAAAGVTGASTASAKAFGAALLVKWLGAGLVAGVVASGVAFGAHVAAERSHRAATGGVHDARRPAAREGARTPAALQGATPMQVGASPAPNNESEPPGKATEAVAPLVTTSSPRPAQKLSEPAAPAPSARTRLAVEMAAIDGIRTLLGNHHPALALERLDAYERESAGGLLSLEAEVLRIEALALLGKNDEVKRRGRLFLAAHPDSPYLERVRSLLERAAP